MNSNSSYHTVMTSLRVITMETQLARLSGFSCGIKVQPRTTQVHGGMQAVCHFVDKAKKSRWSVGVRYEYEIENMNLCKLKGRPSLEDLSYIHLQVRF